MSIEDEGIAKVREWLIGQVEAKIIEMCKDMANVDVPFYMALTDLSFKLKGIRGEKVVIEPREHGKDLV